MKYLLSPLLCVLAVTLSLTPYSGEYISGAPKIQWVIYAQVPIDSPVTPLYDPVPTQEILSLINEKAAEYGVSGEVLYAVIKGESGFDPRTVGDDSYVCPLTGKVSPSYGLSQISSCWHPEISREQAMNPIFAVDFTAKHLSQGKCSWWTVCRNLYPDLY